MSWQVLDSFSIASPVLLSCTYRKHRLFVLYYRVTRCTSWPRPWQMCHLPVSHFLKMIFIHFSRVSATILTGFSLPNLTLAMHPHVCSRHNNRSDKQIIQVSKLTDSVKSHLLNDVHFASKERAYSNTLTNLHEINKRHLVFCASSQELRHSKYVHHDHNMYDADEDSVCFGDTF